MSCDHEWGNTLTNFFFKLKSKFSLNSLVYSKPSWLELCSKKRKKIEVWSWKFFADKKVTRRTISPVSANVNVLSFRHHHFINSIQAARLKKNLFFSDKEIRVKVKALSIQLNNISTSWNIWQHGNKPDSSGNPYLIDSIQQAI